MIYLTNAAQTSSPLYDLFVLCFCICFITFIVFMVKRSKRKKRQFRDESGVIAMTNVVHICGLPIAEGLGTTCTLFDDGILFQSGNMQFNLSMDKIMDICTRTEQEIQNQYVSSAGGALGGAMVFGPLGAIVGGRTKKKQTTKTNKYMIITYKKNDIIEYISFQDTLLNTNKFVNSVKDMIYTNESVAVEL